MLQDLEKEKILSRERERGLIQAGEELQAAREDRAAIAAQLELHQTEATGKQTLITQLQEKFLESSQHILQETVKGLQDELADSYGRVTDYQRQEEEWRQAAARAEALRASLTSQLAEAKAELARVRAELAGEVRTREHRQHRQDSQAGELAAGREREQQLRAETVRLQQQLDRQVERLRTAQERLTGESHQAAAATSSRRGTVVC